LNAESITKNILSYLIFVCIYLILNLMYFLFSIATGISCCGGMCPFGLWHKNVSATASNTAGSGQISKITLSVPAQFSIQSIHLLFSLAAGKESGE
jgi:uncharacterized membrane protein